jgi:hypothetical protein
VLRNVVVLIDNPLLKVCGALERSFVLAGDAARPAPVERAEGYGVLAEVAAVELVVWAQCGSRIG